MICKFCNKRANWIGGICDDCQFHLLGKIHNTSAYDRRWSDGDIVIWIKDEKVVSAWVKDGSVAIPDKVIENMGIIDVVLFLKENKLFCSSCAIPLKDKEVALKHFAGRYCEKCAEKYKQENNTICRLCNKPHWECYC